MSIQKNFYFSLLTSSAKLIEFLKKNTFNEKHIYVYNKNKYEYAFNTNECHYLINNSGKFEKFDYKIFEKEFISIENPIINFNKFNEKFLLKHIQIIEKNSKRKDKIAKIRKKRKINKIINNEKFYIVNQDFNEQFSFNDFIKKIRGFQRYTIIPSVAEKINDKKLNINKVILFRNIITYSDVYKTDLDLFLELKRIEDNKYYEEQMRSIEFYVLDNDLNKDKRLSFDQIISLIKDKPICSINRKTKEILEKKYKYLDEIVLFKDILIYSTAFKKYLNEFNELRYKQKTS
jgi:hypothetical protein